MTAPRSLTPDRRAAIELVAARNPSNPQAQAIYELLSEIDRLTHRRPCPLTGKRWTVLLDAANGGTNITSSRTLGLTPATVRTYRRRIHRQLGVHTVAQAVAVAMASGWISHSLIDIPTSGDPDAR
ncbi:LuxR C-terminal-related transcriptional regulator [Streptomyces scabiei]|nr:LuxR C-terminal-related transcriptional regulator [Streptomyces scabiei]MDX3026783.1 LuxR C-terminal-related transcriptional regulator [Streptomyces scabiei]